MSDHFVRAQLVKLDVDKLAGEAQRCNDPERIRAIGDEIEVRLESLREIHREQLMEQLAPPPSRRPWWKFWASPEEAE